MWLLAHRTRLDYTKRLQDCTHVVPPTMYNTHWLLCCSRWYNFFPSPTGVRTVCMCCQNMQSKMPPSSSTSWWRLPQTTPSTSKMLRETQVHSSCLTCATAFHSCLFIAGPFLCRSGELGNRDLWQWFLVVVKLHGIIIKKMDDRYRKYYHTITGHWEEEKASRLW